MVTIRRIMLHLVAIGTLLSIWQLTPVQAQTPIAVNPVPVKAYLTAPADIPQITVNVQNSGANDGYIFVSNFNPGAYTHQPNPGSYLMILDNSGQLVYYQAVPADTYATDFKVLPNGLLAYWQGAAYHLLDSSYKEVKTFSAGTVGLDPHDLLYLPNGDYAYLLYDYRSMDLSKVVPGGKTNAFVVGAIIQEVDASGNVVFTWNSFDHIPVTDSNQDLTAAEIDYMHPNALILDTDGNFLLSNRHLDEVTKINRQTGAVMWRLGGKANQFTFSAASGIPDGPQFYYQHDVRILPNGHLTVFDNHNLHDTMKSRALEYVLDEQKKTATLVWEYHNTPEVASGFMGSVQRFPNGNTLIGWGGVSAPALTEIRPDGSKALELSFSDPYVSYRAVRSPWQGHPTWAPALILQSSGNAVNLTFSWNGATDVSGYQILAGNNAQSARSVGEVARSGFETSASLTGRQARYCEYWVMPLDNQGQPTQYSNPVTNPACNSRLP